MLVAGAVKALDRELARHLDSGTTSSNAAGAEQTFGDSSSPSCSAHSGHSGSEQGRIMDTGQATSPILELVLEGKPVAVAVRKHGRLPHPQACTPSSQAGHSDIEDNYGVARQHCHNATGGANSAVSDGTEKGTWTCIYAMDGTVLAAERDGNLHKDGVAGSPTHTVLTGQTPLVRHLHVVSIAGGRPTGLPNGLFSALLFALHATLPWTAVCCVSTGQST